MDQKQIAIIPQNIQYEPFLQEMEMLDKLQTLAKYYVEAEMVPMSYYDFPRDEKGYKKKYFNQVTKEQRAEMDAKCIKKVALSFAKGAAYGWRPQQCLEWQYVVGGKVTTYAAGVSNLIQNHPDFQAISYEHEVDEKGKWLRTVGHIVKKSLPQQVIDVEYTRDMLVTSGLVAKNAVWKTNPYDMATWKVLARVQKVHFPVGTEMVEDLEDLGDIRSDDEVQYELSATDQVKQMSSNPEPQDLEVEAMARVLDLEGKEVYVDLELYLASIKELAPKAHTHGLGILIRWAGENAEEEGLQSNQEDPPKESASEPEKTPKAKTEPKKKEKATKPNSESAKLEDFTGKIKVLLTTEKYMDVLTEEEMAQFKGKSTESEYKQLFDLLQSAEKFRKKLQGTDLGVARLELIEDEKYAKYKDMDWCQALVFERSA